MDGHASMLGLHIAIFDITCVLRVELGKSKEEPFTKGKTLKYLSWMALQACFDLHRLATNVVVLQNNEWPAEGSSVKNLSWVAPRVCVDFTG